MAFASGAARKASPAGQSAQNIAGQNGTEQNRTASGHSSKRGHRLAVAMTSPAAGLPLSMSGGGFCYPPAADAAPNDGSRLARYLFVAGAVSGGPAWSAAPEKELGSADLLLVTLLCRLAVLTTPHPPRGGFLRDRRRILLRLVFARPTLHSAPGRRQIS